MYILGLTSYATKSLVLLSRTAKTPFEEAAILTMDGRGEAATTLKFTSLCLF